MEGKELTKPVSIWLFNGKASAVKEENSAIQAIAIFCIDR
jgi:hypothetical protein